jgi:hypothetical protein
MPAQTCARPETKMGGSAILTASDAKSTVGLELLRQRGVDLAAEERRCSSGADKHFNRLSR